MEDKKYELVKEDSITIGNKTLYRIRALREFNDVKKGELGGYIEKEDNLSHYGNCWVFGNARVYDNARAFGNATVYGNAWVYDDSEVYDNARVFANVMVYGEARVFGNAWVYDNARVFGNAKIKSNDDYCYIHGFGSENRSTTFFRTEDGDIYVRCGCFKGNLEKFKNKVIETHGDNKYAKEYLKIIELVKIKFDLEDDKNE